jgi:serine/threonine protein kinase
MTENDNIGHNEMLAVGTTLQGGKYRVERCLASGGFGNTYVVQNTVFGELMAMKEFFMRGVSERNDHSTVSVSNATNQASFDGQREKFRKEALRLRKLHNEHIVQVHDLFDENGTSYYVMDYIDGESLAQRLERTGKPLSEAEALKLMEQVLDALEVTHAQRIWHLDLKPGNIMVDSNGIVKLIDFGASKQMSANDGYTTTTTALCYTPGYAPLEQIDQKMELIGPWTDLYALGGTLYNLLTRHQPPMGSELHEKYAFVYPEGISQRTRELISWMMSPHRTARPQSVAQVRQFLAENVDVASEEENTLLNFIHKNEEDDNKDIDNARNDSVKKSWWKSGKVIGIIIAAVALLGIVGWFAFGTDKAQSYYEQGKALYDKKEYVEAVQFLKKAADLNHADAQNKLGVCYEKGRGVEMNIEKALEWYRKAAEQGNAYAQCNLAFCYANGNGVEKDDEQAEQWYKKAVPIFKEAAEQGDADAQVWLGWCYEYGHGIDKDCEEAVKWYRKAAEQGNDRAQNNLGVCYKNGTGVEKNPEKAVYWYRKAAEQGYDRAQNSLGWCYEYGEGVEMYSTLTRSTTKATAMCFQWMK